MTLRATYNDYRTDTTSAAASLDLIAALGLCAVVYVEHRHAIRSSAFLGVYLAICLLIGIAETRSYFMRHLTALGGVTVARAAACLALLALEEIPKRHLIIDDEIRQASEGEATSGFWTRAFFIYLSPIFRHGTRGELRMDNLTGIGIEFSSARLFAQLSSHWPLERRKARHSLFFACCRAFAGAIVAAALPRLLVSGLTFAQPFTMQRVIAAIGKDEDDRETNGALVGATLLSFGGAAVCNAIAAQLQYRLLTLIRGSLVAQLMDKNLKLELSEARRNAAVTLMTADFEGITAGLKYCFSIPFTFVEVGLGMYFLTKFLKQSSFVVLLPLITTTVAGIIIGKYMSKANKNWNEKIENRVSKTSQILSQLPPIKMLGLGPKTLEFIQHLRVQEVEASKKFRNIQVGLLSSVTLTDLLLPTIVVAASLFWGIFGSEINPEIMYPALAIVVLIQTPLVRLFNAYPTTITMLGCFERIQQFLCQEEHVDPRVLLSNLPREVTREWPRKDGPSVTMTRVVQRDFTRVVHFDNVSLCPRGTDNLVLKDIEMSIEPGSINAVFGQTGCGKTTFLHSILGEATISDGILYVDDTAIALVDQSAFLPNASIRDCVVGSCEYDVAWFNTVITECLLDEDIATFPDGADHIVGSGGLALSGGQRQRLGLARAAYSRMRLVILDDPFSALDGPTAISILRKLCGPQGIFRQSNSTVVFSSYLQESMDFADNLIYLDGDGNVTYEPGYLNHELHARIRNLLRQDHQASASDVEEVEAAATGQSLASINKTSAIVRAEQNIPLKGDFSLYRFWIEHVGRLVLLVWVALVSITGTSDGLPRIYLKYWIERGPGDRLWFIGYALLPIASTLVGAASLYVLFNIVCPQTSLRMHKRVADVVMHSTLGFLTTTDSGSVLSRFSVDMDILTKRVPNSLHNTFYYSVGAIVQTCIALSGATYMSALIPVLIVALYYVQSYYVLTSRQLRRLDLESQAPIVTWLREASDGLIYIRSFGWQSQKLPHAFYLLDQSQKPIYLLYCAQQLLGLVSDLLAAFIGVILAILTLFVKTGTSPNSAGLSFLAIVVLGSCFNDAIVAWTNLETAIGSLSRMRDFLEETAVESDKGTTSLPEHWPFSGAVEITNVSARYRSDETEQTPVIQNISLSIPAGKKCGVIGRTGSGKSSLLYTLLGFLDYEGSIVIDGIDIATAPRDQLRSRIVTISQDQVELDGTVRDNLLPYDKRWGGPVRELDEKEQVEAARKDLIVEQTLIRLRIWDQLEEMGGLDAQLKDVGFSHGEMQLLCIARAVVRRRLTGSKLLLVDEATGNLDRFRDQTVREMMRAYFQGCTIIVVAHREESIADSNMTVEMVNGFMREPETYY